MRDDKLRDFSIIVASGEYVDGVDEKSRPFLVLKVDGKIIYTYKITTKFKEKSRGIKNKYFELVDYLASGLKEQSWVDTINVYEVDRDKTKITVIGEMTEKDELRLMDFLSNPGFK